MDYYEQNYGIIIDYVRYCKFINKYKLVNRFDCSGEEAYSIIDSLLDDGEIYPMTNFDFRVACKTNIREE